MFCNPLVQKYGGINLHRNMLKIFTQELWIWWIVQEWPESVGW